MTPSRRRTSPGDARLLGDLPHRGLLRRLVALEVPLGQAPLEAAGAVAAGDDGGVVDAVAAADDDAAGRGLVDDGQRDGGHPDERVARVDAQRMTARWRWDAPGDGWVRRARHIDTVTTRHAGSRPHRGRSLARVGCVPLRAGALARPHPPLHSTQHSTGRLGRVPSLDPPVNPETPDLSAALVALQKRALGVLAGLPRRRPRAGRALPRGGARARARRRPGARRLPRAGVGATSTSRRRRRRTRPRRSWRAGATRTGTSARSSAPSARAGSRVVARWPRTSSSRSPRTAPTSTTPRRASRRSRSATPSRATCPGATSP